MTPSFSIALSDVQTSNYSSNLFISPESLNIGREQRKTNWSPMSAAPEAKLLNNTGEYLIITKIKRKSKKHKQKHICV